MLLQKAINCFHRCEGIIAGHETRRHDGCLFFSDFKVRFRASTPTGVKMGGSKRVDPVEFFRVLEQDGIEAARNLFVAPAKRKSRKKQNRRRRRRSSVLN